jgi:hypothetical protein
VSPEETQNRETKKRKPPGERDWHVASRKERQTATRKKQIMEFPLMLWRKHKPNGNLTSYFRLPKFE